MYIASHGELRGAAFDQHPQLLVWDADSILERLAARVNDYDGPLTSQAFSSWAETWVRREANRIRLTETILRENRRVVGAAVRRGLEGLPEEASVSVEDVASEVAVLIHKYAESLAKQGTAKQSTRVTALVRNHVRKYHGAYRIRRHRRLRGLVAKGDVLQMGEVLTPEQIASERLAEVNAVAA